MGSRIWLEGKRDWEKEFEKLQYQALRKYTGATRGARIGTVNQIAGVDSLRMAMETAQAHFM